MPIRTVVKLSTRLRNQKMLTRIVEDEVVVVSEVGSKGKGCCVTLANVSRRSAIRASRTTERSEESGRRDLQDSTTNAVTTAENKPALKDNFELTRTHDNEDTNKYEKILHLVLPCIALNFVLLQQRLQYELPWITVWLWNWILVWITWAPHLWFLCVMFRRLTVLSEKGANLSR